MGFSSTYTFGTSQSDQLIADAFERAGIKPDVVTGLQVTSAQRSINFILSEWINRGLNLWTVTQSMLNLVPNQSSYQLPIPTSDVLEATIRTSQRQLGGLALSSSGVAANAFDGNSATACIQNAPDGWIAYNYGAGIQYAIAMVGVQSNATLTYTLNFQYSNDNINWFTVLSVPAQQYLIGSNTWFVIPVPIFGQYFRIIETGGATLNIQELYFNTALLDIPITRISRSDYIDIPNKAQTGRPTSFWVDRQINPNIYIWPTPTQPYNNLFYTRVRMLQDIGSLINMAEIPQRFYDALTAGLAIRLAVKYSPDKERLMLLKEEYRDAFDMAAREDAERVPLRIFGSYESGWTTV
jgi:hypothetical protein